MSTTCKRCGSSERYRSNCKPCKRDYKRRTRIRKPRTKVDPKINRLRKGLRNRLRKAIQTKARTGSAVKDLGCSIPALIVHLTAQFKVGMTWENYGDWHIDHIKPLSSFDLTDRSQLLSACHYSNLQPLWAKDNQSKGAVI